MKERNSGCYAETCALISHITILWRGEAHLMNTYSKRAIVEKPPYTDMFFSSRPEESCKVWADLHIMYSEACAAAGDKWHDCYRLNGLAGFVGPKWKENLTDLLTDLKKDHDDKKSGTIVDHLYRMIAHGCLASKIFTLLL